jgi:hypothetical protein
MIYRASVALAFRLVSAGGATPCRLGFPKIAHFWRSFLALVAVAAKYFFSSLSY